MHNFKSNFHFLFFALIIFSPLLYFYLDNAKWEVMALGIVASITLLVFTSSEFNLIKLSKDGVELRRVIKEAEVTAQILSSKIELLLTYDMENFVNKLHNHNLGIMVTKLQTISLVMRDEKILSIELTKSIEKILSRIAEQCITEIEGFIFSYHYENLLHLNISKEQTNNELQMLKDLFFEKGTYQLKSTWPTPKDIKEVFKNKDFVFEKEYKSWLQYYIDGYEAIENLI
ncbi:hypothetical protein AB6M11_000679 [Listeria monocytogenes]|nr:hypothetical protein [Listeria monocytogenes]EAF5965645.1 hypothetical protein [Listeria monocytogenes]EKZ4625765.1 hypothetical protein [Listeria monocytogenes]HAA6474331.1 hypothetical protein [Listeria monocytogenes]